MQNLKKLHRKAMRISQKAFVKKEEGYKNEARELYLEAFELEKKVALSLKDQAENQPTRAILFRSAAYLALKIENFEEAQELALEGLNHNPPENEKQEFLKILNIVSTNMNSKKEIAFYTIEEIKDEIENPARENNTPYAFAGKKYPIEYLDSRDFELLVYFIFKKEIDSRINEVTFDTVRLMKGTADRGRDLLLQLDNKNVGVIQCKRYNNLITKPDLSREIIKFILHAIQDKTFIHEINDFTYYFVALKGFNDKAQELLRDFNTLIIQEAKLQNWIEEVIEENKSITLSYETSKSEVLKILENISIQEITGHDLQIKLKQAKDVVSVFFEVEKVASEDMLRKVFSEYMPHINDEDLEKLRKNIQNIPKEKRMPFGIFNMYGYDLNFYKKLSKKQGFFYKVAGIRHDIYTTFIDYLKETIEKYILLFISGDAKISPFTKQVIFPYLFNKYGLIYQKSTNGKFMSETLSEEHSESVIYKYQTIEEHKEYFLKMGEKILNNDYSEVVGDKELLEVKKEILDWTHKEFSNIDEMSERFDSDIKILKPRIKHIEKYIEDIIPENSMIIIDSLDFSKEDLGKLSKKMKKLED